MITTPGLLNEVTTKLAEGPAVQPIPVEVPVGAQRLVILWRELPQRVAAVLVAIGAVLWLMVSPTAPNAAKQAAELLHQYRPTTTSAVVELPAHPAPTVPGPRKRTREVERVVTQQDRRRADVPSTATVSPVGQPS